MKSSNPELFFIVTEPRTRDNIIITQYLFSVLVKGKQTLARKPHEVEMISIGMWEHAVVLTKHTGTAILCQLHYKYNLITSKTKSMLLKITP
jgi:hypothetical protein